MRNGKVLVFLDIDGTLVDSKHGKGITTKQLKTVRREIRRLENAGVVFGINSNRSLEDIAPVYKKFGLNGPMVAENGLLCKIKSKTIFLGQADGKELNRIKAMKLRVETEARAFLKRRYGGSVQWLDADTVRILQRKGNRFKAGALLALNNKFRKYTTSVHLMRARSGRLVRARKEGLELVSYLNERFGHPRKFEILVSQFGNLLFFSSSASKRSAVRELLRTLYRGYYCYAIGDEMGDYEMVKDFGRFLAVRNAQPQARRFAYFTSSRRYSGGVVDLLQRIAGDEPSGSKR